MNNILNNPNFKRWFGNSITIDSKTGEPQVFYHGTDTIFDTFEVQHTATGFYFSPDYNTAAYYGDNIYSVYLKIENPLDLTDDVERYKVLADIFGSDEKEWSKMDDNAGIYYPATDKEAIRFVVNNFKGNEQGWVSLIPELKDTDLSNLENVADDLNYEMFGWSELEVIAKNNPSIAKRLKAQGFELVDQELQEVLQAYGSQDFYMHYQDDLMHYAIHNGYDGVIFDDPSSTGESLSYVVFNANQIKNVDNNGNFSLGSDNMYEGVTLLPLKTILN